MEFAPSEVQSALACVKREGMSAEERHLAVRNVKRMAKDDPSCSGFLQTPVVIQLYVALKRLQGDKARITLERLVEWREEIVQEVALRRKCWVISKATLKIIPETCRPYLVTDAEQLDSMCLRVCVSMTCTSSIAPARSTGWGLG